MDLTTEALRLSMGLARTRAEVASANIANVDTPGYRAQRADFGQAVGLLQQAASHAEMSGETLRVEGERDIASKVTRSDADDAGVQLDGEVADLEAASTDYQSMTAVLSRRFSLMQLALAGRN
ncbi:MULTISPECIES: flagellar basal body rod protein FlgB [Dyella]|jgi:flagellar basal-body rod protein FlgB|uniref:flagellar basal body rod protein FlgB n=1 Tax=Dyella TaxID=231454 RepID=UPI000C84E17E|nr:MULTISPECIES: flagellar basal body protein [Dyella]MDR3443744.1 flagellar basal body protein [Dyella sp.]PMQ04549.1 Flagellar basal body rod protein FlgB [Dyella sp. AD56]ULU23707.1 flagellar basal body protein [Dyella terrae]